jgi:phenylacetate-CoA ligase
VPETGDAARSTRSPDRGVARPELFDDHERLTLDEARQEARSRLAAHLADLSRTSPFYARKWGSGLTNAAAAATAATVEALLPALPFTVKDELRAAQERRPPFGDHLACAPEQVARMHRTSGTTGRPLLIALTARDAERTQSYGARAFWCAGLRPDDIVVHCLNYCMWSGGLTDHLCLERTGATVVPFGIGNTDALIDLPRWTPVTALSCTPSYVKLLLERLTDEQHARWAATLRLVLVGGEPGGSNLALQREIHEALNARLVDANYGLAEVLSIFSSACPSEHGMHFHGLGALWPELIEPDTQTVLTPAPGTTGELVLTHVERDAQPLVRYRTGDLLEIVSIDRCSCGRGGPRFLLRGRSDQMFVVRGVNIFPSAIADVLGSLPIPLTEFMVTLPDADVFDAIDLQVEAPTDDDGLAASIAGEIKRTLGCTANVALVAAGSLPRSEGKVPRVQRSPQGSRD